METGNPDWALRTLQARWEELEDVIKANERRRGVNQDLLQALRDECVQCRLRYYEIMHLDMKGIKTDLYPEFQMLCEDIKDLRMQLHETIARWMKLNLGLTVAGTAAVGILQCIAGIEMAIFVSITSMCGIGSVRIGSAARTIHRSRSTYERKEDKIFDLQRALASTTDLRFACEAMQTIGFERFQEINDVNACNALPR